MAGITNIELITEALNTQQKIYNTVISKALSVGNINIADVVKSQKTLSKIDSFVESYLGSVDKVINVLTKQYPGSKSLSEALGYVEDIEDENGEIIKKGGYKNIEAIQAVFQLYSGLSKTIDTIAKIEINGASVQRITRKSRMISKIFQASVTSLITEFSKIDTKSLISMMGVLATKPDTITKIAHSEKTYDPNNKNLVKDISGSRDITEGGKLGLLDIMDKLLSIITTIIGMKLPNPITFTLKVKLFKRGIGFIFKNILSIASEFSNKQNIETLAKFSKLTTSLNDSLTSFITVDYTINKLGDSLSKNLVKLTLVRWTALPLFLKTVDQILNIPNHFKEAGGLSEILPELKKFIDDIGPVIISIQGFIDHVNDLSDSLIKFGLGKWITVKIGAETTTQILNILIHKDKKTNKPAGLIVGIIELGQYLDEIDIKDSADKLDSVKNLLNGILGLVGNIGLLALAFPVVLLSYLPALGTLHLIKNIVYLSIHILNVIGKITDGKEYKNTVIAVSNITKVLGLILLMVAEVLGTLVLISLTLPLLTKSFWTTVGVFTIISGLVLLIAGLAWLINRMFRGGVGKTISEGLLLMISLIGVMLLVTGQLMLFAYAGILMFGEDWEGGLWLHAAAMFGMVATTTLLIGGIGYLLTLMLPGIIAFAVSSVSLLISIGAMLLVAGMLVGLAKFEFEEDTQQKVQEKTKLIIDTAHDIMNAMFRGWTKDESGKLTSNESEDSGFKRFFKGMFQGGAMVVEILASSMVLVMTFVSVTMLLATAAMLEVVGKIDLNSPAITSNIGMVIGVAHGVIDAVLNKETPATKGTPEDKKGPIRSLLSGVGDVFKGIKNIIDGVLSFGFIAFTMVSIGMITLIAKNLKYLEGIELNQKTVETKVQAVIGTANSLINHINESNINKDNVKKAELTRDFMKQIEKTVGHMSKIGEMNNQGQFDKAIDSYVRFVDKINTVKLENLQTATNMFEKMAEFSKSISGNFEGLADAINDKIMPLLEQLNESLGKTNEHIENGTFSIPTAPASTSAPVSAGGTTPNGNVHVAPQKDYSRILGEIKQEITKVQKTLTDGSQITNIETR